MPTMYLILQNTGDKNLDTFLLCVQSIPMVKDILGGRSKHLSIAHWTESSSGPQSQLRAEGVRGNVWSHCFTKG